LTKAHQEHISKVKKVSKKHPTRLQRFEPDDAIDEEVYRNTSTAHHRKPPPTMILVYKLVVHEQNGNFCTGNEQNRKDNKREPKHVVVLIHPKTRHHEE
jgi:hypothetical protein